MAALLGGAAIAMPAAAQEDIEWTPELCAAEWITFDLNNDGRLDFAEQSEPFTKVETNVDTNNDDFISQEEFTVVCTSGVFDDMKKQG